MKAFPNGSAGAAVVMNYKTGEVLGMVSLPAFDPNNVEAVSEDDPNTPFWNRVTQAKYPPGSTFKIITMASALLNIPDITSRTFICTGQLPVLNDVITDFGDAVHNDRTLTQAFTVSCNNIFASIALELTDDRLRKTAEAFGFNDNFLFKDLVVENSVYPTTGRDKLQIAWSGAGQGKVETTPLHMCMVAAAVANDGVMMEPGLIKAVVNENGVSRKEYTPKVYRRAIPEDIAQFIKTAMRTVTISGTGVNAQVDGLKVCGKTGSAEATIDHVDVVHGWYVGFLDEPDLPYAVSVIVERGESGSGSAAPIAKQIFQYLKNNYK
jgi:peptidoglycan glycosyltransferase